MNTYKQQRLEEYDKFIEPAVNNYESQKEYNERVAWYIDIMSLDIKDFIAKTIDDMDKKVEEAKTQVRVDVINEWSAFIANLRANKDLKKEDILELIQFRLDRKYKSLTGKYPNSLKEGSK